MRLHFLLFLLLSTVVPAQESTASKQVSTFSIDAPQLGTARNIWVWLPEHYADSGKKYPVLYMHDAQNVFDRKTSFAGEWEADETLEKMKAEIIVVAIEHGNEKRIEELTPFKNAKYGGGKANDYLDFVVKNLKPEIDKRYRTKPDGKNTAIMGSSLGGLVSFYALLKYPEVFGKAGVFSPSFWFSKDIYDMAEATAAKGKRIFFLCGTKEDTETVPDMKRMAAIVKRNGADVEEHVIDAGEHNEKLWREHFGRAVSWLFR